MSAPDVDENASVPAERPDKEIMSYLQVHFCLAALGAYQAMMQN